MENILEALARKSPSMRTFLDKREKRRKETLEKAKGNLDTIRKELGLSQQYEFASDDALIDAYEKVKAQQDYDNACSHCKYTVENCEECRYNVGGGYVYERNLINWKPCNKYKVHIEQERINRLINDSGMGARFSTRTFETFQTNMETEAARKAAETFCNDIKADKQAQGLMLIGPYGCGKTHLAAAILHRCAEKGIAGIFVTVPELLAKIRTSYRTGDGKAEEIIDAAEKTKLLILDDLGAEKASDWVREQIYMLINYRYEHMLPLVITTNNTGAELEAELGRRTLSRLAEMTKPIKISAPDYRMKIASGR